MSGMSRPPVVTGTRYTPGHDGVTRCIGAVSAHPPVLVHYWKLAKHSPVPLRAGVR